MDFHQSFCLSFLKEFPENYALYFCVATRTRHVCKVERELFLRICDIGMIAMSIEILGETGSI